MLPPPIAAYLASTTIEKYTPAYLSLAPHGEEVRSFGGDWARFGLQQNVPLQEQLPVLFGAFPLEAPILFTDVELANGVIADLHVFEEGNQTWVLLMDVSESHNMRQKLHQRANELHLIRQYFGKLNVSEVGEAHPRLEEAILARCEEGGFMEAAVLEMLIWANVEEPDGYLGQVMFKEIGLFLHRAAQLLSENYGWRMSLNASGLQAVFGILPDLAPPKQRAEQVAQALASLLHSGIRISDKSGKLWPLLELKGGIASGLIAVGVIQEGTRRRVSALGLPFQKALEQAIAAPRGQIKIWVETPR